jgi:putative transposase
VRLVVPDAQEGLKAAIARVLGAGWRRCGVHRMGSALAHAPRGRRTMVAAALRQAFPRADQESARHAWRHVAGQLRPRWPRLAALMDESEPDVLACMAFPAQHRAKPHSTDPLERLDKGVKRRADVVGTFPPGAAVVRLVGAVLLEQNDERRLQHRHVRAEGMAELLGSPTAPETLRLPPKAA